MSKKTCLHSLPKESKLKMKRLRCSICLTEAESIFYVCKSGRHVICKSCQRIDLKKNRHDNGDHKTEKEGVQTEKKEIVLTNNLERNHQHLASGDHFYPVDKKSVSKTNNEVPKKKCRLTTSTPKDQSKCDFTVTINIANTNTNSQTSKSKSSVALSVISPDSNIEAKMCEPNPRPVTCPVTECSKMVTLDSLSQHFNFDHSKVPRLIYNEIEAREICINYSTLSTNSKCLASFVLLQKRSSLTTVKKEESASNLHNSYKGDIVLALMASKIVIPYTKLFEINYVSRASTRNSNYLQTDMNKNNYQSHKQASGKSSSRVVTETNKSSYSDDDEEEVILLWLCKFDNKDRVYTIMATREDKKQGYSYTGDAVYIRREHSPISIYNNAECLSINRKAINKLITTKNEFKVLVSPI